MNVLDLVVLYAIGGVACAVAVYARGREHPSRAFGSALAALIVWPLWVPIALGPRRRAGTPPSGSWIAQRIEAALREGVKASAGTPLAQLLPEEAAETIVEQVRRTEARIAELDQLLAREELDLARARERLERLSREGAPERVLLTARLHLANVERLWAVREADRRALDELLDLVSTLRTQLVLARYAGSSVEGVGSIVAEVFARVEGLHEATHEVAVDPAEWARERPSAPAAPFIPRDGC